MKNPAHYPVAQGKANYAGDIVAVVVAESRYAAADGLEGVVVDYEPLDAVVTIEDAESDRVVIHEDCGTNVSYEWPLVPDPDAVEAAFADAAHHVTETFVHQRLIPTAMEPRGVAAVPAPHNGNMTLYSSTQIPHILKVMAAITLGLPEQKVRSSHPPWGRFGCKLNVYAEEVICMALAQRHGVPVRWTEGRTEASGFDNSGEGPASDHRVGGRRRREAHRRAGHPAGRHGCLPAAGRPRCAAARGIPVPRALRRARLLVHL